MVDDSHAAGDGELGSHVGFVDDGSHRLFLLLRVSLPQDLHDVRDPIEAVSVLEHLGLVGRKMRGEIAVLDAPSSLVLARSTGLACASFDRHGRKKRAFINVFDDHKSKIFENSKNGMGLKRFMNRNESTEI